MRPLIWLTALTLCACFALAPSPAAADTPDTPALCDTAREVRFFVLGVRKGRNLAESAIARATDPADVCDDLDAIDDLREIIAAIVDDIDVPVGASEPTQCHVLGQIAGLLAEITELQDECGDLCIADGQLIGEISAFLYCELSIALGGLELTELFERLATDACGVRFQVACDTKFEQVATGDPECLPFTEGAFGPVYLEAQNNQCADNPDED
jgi:hypothetical protein